eukprot:3087836-Amphidinium_carterae.1
MGMLEMKKELAFYQLPEDVKIARDSAGADVIGLRASLAQLRKELASRTVASRHLAIGSEVANMLCNKDMTQNQVSVEIEYVDPRQGGLQVSGFQRQDLKAVHSVVRTAVEAYGFSVVTFASNNHARFSLVPVGDED